MPAGVNRLQRFQCGVLLFLHARLHYNPCAALYHCCHTANAAQGAAAGVVGLSSSVQASAGRLNETNIFVMLQLLAHTLTCIR